ncbi:MAG: hypothetical protein K2I43_03650, partial [Alistipes sp.]|nr:hypothetical protein [Alistipes sp.]
FQTVCMLFAAAVVLCSCGDDDTAAKVEPKGPRIPTLDELVGVWNSGMCKFDLDKKGWAYELDLEYSAPYYDGFAHDENGDYVRITVQEYCEQYAADYNADPANTDKLTAEEAGTREFSELLVSRITVDAGRFMFEQGNKAGIVTLIDGTSVYDETTGVFTITRDSGYDAGEVIEVSVFEDADGVMTFTVNSEWYSFYTATYDDSKRYWVFCTIYYFSEKAE